MKDGEHIILGVDISTSVTGLSLYRYRDGSVPFDGEIMLITSLVLKIPPLIKGTEALFVKQKMFAERLNELSMLVKTACDDCRIDTCIIEEPLLQSNNCHTAGTLLKFNGMVSSVIYSRLGIVPNYISSYESRYYAFPELVAVHRFNKKNVKRSREEIKKGIKNGKLALFGSYPFQVEKKVVILDMITQMFPSIQWAYDSRGKLLKSNYDGSDAFCCIIGWLNKHYYNGARLSITDMEERENILRYSTSFGGQDKWHHQVVFDDVRSGVDDKEEAR